jgi:prefoldin subunit 5
MREQMQARLEALRKELETGQAEFETIERRQTYLRETMLRISGAIQVLEELLTEGQPGRRNGTGPGETQLADARANEPSI